MQIFQFNVLREFQIFGGALAAFYIVQDGCEAFRREAVQNGEIAEAKPQCGFATGWRFVY
jgi:hypothetical protein